MQLIQDTYAAFQESLFSRPDPRMADLQPFADTFLRLFQEHQFSHSENEPITSLTLQNSYQFSSPLLVANDSVSIPILLSMLTNKLHNGMLFFLS